LSKREHLAIGVPSRLFIYFCERTIEGTVSSDAGAEIRDGIKSVNQWGVCPEKEWPYVTSKFAVKPSAKCYTDAAKQKALVYKSINQDVTSMKTCLATGYPFVYGFTVYDSFESDAVAANGIVPMPAADEEVLGGHAVSAVGYNDSAETVDGIPPRTRQPGR
jgi:C1A family cysteine protease